LKAILEKHHNAQRVYDDLTKLIDDYNKWVIIKRQFCTNIYASTDTRTSDELTRFLMGFIYNRAIIDPTMLNKYQPFSPEVYGETSYDLIDSLLKRVSLKETDTFMDLGSGVGNIVLQVAASSKCQCCYGFEKAEWPSFFALVTV
jgi:H3 lysine-79-specific histone-lysine N-methyltransferase